MDQQLRSQTESWNDLVERLVKLVKILASEVGDVTPGWVDISKSSSAALDWAKTKGVSGGLYRVAQYTPGVGLVIAVYTAIYGRKEEWKAVLIRQVNGLISVGALVGAAFVPLAGAALFASSVAIGAAGHALGTTVEVLAKDCINDLELRKTMATWSDVMVSAVVGALCGMLSAFAVGFDWREVLGSVGELLQSALGSEGKLAAKTIMSNLVGVTAESSRAKVENQVLFQRCKAALLHAEMWLYNHRAKMATTDEEITENLNKADQIYQECQELRKKVGDRLLEKPKSE